MSADYYAILELLPGATQKEIRTSYRRLALLWHPDRSRAPDAAARFRAITEAYHALRLPERRRAYDEAMLFRTAREPHRPKSAKAGRAVLSWVDEFFIQAGGIEAEGPGKGSLRRFSAQDLELIWRDVTARLVLHGEVRQTLRQFELLAYYVGRHGDQAWPRDAHERLTEKRARLCTLEALRFGTRFPWTETQASLEDLLRKHHFSAARSLLLWRAAHRYAERLAETGLFEACPEWDTPMKELAMVDRLEALAAGEKPAPRLGHGYTVCRKCGGWAMRWGIGAPRCASCGSSRFGLRPRDERDDWLRRLVGRSLPEFSTLENRRRDAAQLGVERWFWAPLFASAFLFSLPALAAGISGLHLTAVTAFAAGWWASSWRSGDCPPADTDVLYPDEWEVTRNLFRLVYFGMVGWLVLSAVIFAIGTHWAPMFSTAAAAGILFAAPSIRRGLQNYGSRS